MKLSQWLFSLSLLIGASSPAIATCVKVTTTSQLSASAIAAGYTAASWTGSCDTCNGKLGMPAVISINSGSNFQPSGTLLASATGNFLTGAYSGGFASNQVLFRCALADADSLYEFYSTNGDNAYTGAYLASEVDGAYYDVARNVAARLTNLTTGEYYSRYWKSRQLNADDLYQDDTYIYVPASVFSDVLYELFKISSTSYYVSSATRYTDAYTQPRGYIAFKGQGISTALVDGSDHASNYSGWYTYWPGAWSTYSQVTYVRSAACEVKDYPNYVSLPTISTAALTNGEVSQASFTVSVECESGAVSGVTSSSSTPNVAMGFLVNNASAVSAATTLGLVSSGGGITWLLDTNYGSSGVASGVGIRVYNSAGNAINLLPDLSSVGTGNTRGWYGFKDLTTLASSDSTDIYEGSFIASLEAISGQTVTAGTVNAQLQVIVSFQ